MNATRTFTVKFKIGIVATVRSGRKTAAEFCREHQSSPNLLATWRAQYEAAIKQAFDRPRPQDPAPLNVRTFSGEDRGARAIARAEDRGTGSGAEGARFFSPAQRRACLTALRDTYPVSMLSSLLGLSRSSVYDRAHPRDDAPIAEVLAHHLQRAKLPVGRKRVRRRMKALGIQRPARRRRVRTTNSAHPYPRYPNRVKDRRATRPDEIWVADITYIRLRRGHIYLAVLMDQYTRAIRGWELSASIDEQLTMAALTNALAAHAARRSITAIKASSTRRRTTRRI